VIVISSDLPEVLAVSDRIVVVKNGRVRGELSRSEATKGARGGMSGLRPSRFRKGHLQERSMDD
jgi:ABC-type uncharacterized transport system ATPase subunit